MPGMWDDVSRLFGGIASLPAGALVGAARLAMDAPCVLELEIAHLEDAPTRQRLLHRLARAGADPSVRAVLLRLEAPPGRFAACHDLRLAIAALRTAGKPVYAACERLGNATMWIAAACDKVFLIPTGEVIWIGLCAELTFFGDLLDRLGIEADFVAAGAYKSFGEAFLRKYASPANQEATRTLMLDLQERIVTDVAAGRSIPVETARALLDRGPFTASQALEAGLVDRLAYHDEVKAFLDTTHPKCESTDFGAWARRDVASEWADRLALPAPSVAVVYLDGGIVSDDHGPGTRIRAKRACKVLDAIYEDKSIKAVVLHVDSPGGSAVASDVIWREVDRLAKTRPVVACFEDVSASGGVYLAAPAHRIVARPTTITGSIGVFGGKLVVGEALRRAGVMTQLVPLAENADVFSATHKWTDVQRAHYRQTLQAFYDGFVDRVASGRKRPVAEIEPHCRGRVWTGNQALSLGLIDEIGGRAEAIAAAARLAELKGDVGVRDVSVQPHRSVVAHLLQGAWKSVVPGEARIARVLAALDGFGGEALDVVLAHPDEPMAMLPYTVLLR